MTSDSMNVNPTAIPHLLRAFVAMGYDPGDALVDALWVIVRYNLHLLPDRVREIQLYLLNLYFCSRSWQSLLVPGSVICCAAGPCNGLETHIVA